MTLLKKDEGVRMAVDYREVNMKLEPTANQLPYHPFQFQRLDGQQFFAKFDNLWGYHQVRLAEDSSKVCYHYSMGSISLFGMPI